MKYNINIAIILSCLFLLANANPLKKPASEQRTADALKKVQEDDTFFTNDFLERIMLKHPELLEQLVETIGRNEDNSENRDSGDDNEASLHHEFLLGDNISPSNRLRRERRRISVLKNIYQQCRIQKRKGKDLCLYLANLYQNVKGFHGL